MIKEYVLICIGICLANMAYSQEDKIDKILRVLTETFQPPALSQQQMYNDFDTLIAIMERNNTQIPFVNKMTQSDVLSEMRSLRSEIRPHMTMPEFIGVLDKVLRLTLDRHCNQEGLTLWMFPKEFKNDFKKYGGLNDTIFGYNFNYEAYTRKNIKRLLMLAYVDTCYFFENDLVIYHAGKENVLSRGTELTMINNTKIADFIKETKDLQYDIRWDYDRNGFYLYALCVGQHMEITDITVRNADKQEVNYKTDSLKSEVIKYSKDAMWANRRRKESLFLLEKDAVLYLRLPMMSQHFTKEYVKQIRQMDSKKFSTIIIDVRGNGGGNDLTWWKLLSNIIDEPISAPVILAAKKNSDEITKLSTRKRKKLKPLSYDFIGEDTFCIAIDAAKQKISPSLRSIRFSGEIILMLDHDSYSSTGALAAVALQTDRITSLGINTGRLLGSGVTPGTFMLPESKYTFKLNKYIDANNVTSIRSVYKDSVEHAINLPVEYYIEQANTEELLYSKDYLLNKDDFFRQVLDYIRSK